MPWIARDDDGTVGFYSIKPKWSEADGEWQDPIDLDDWVKLHRGFPPVKKGECVKVKLVRDDA